MATVKIEWKSDKAFKGIRWIENGDGTRTYYIRFKRDGKSYQQKIGSSTDPRFSTLNKVKGYRLKYMTGALETKQEKRAREQEQEKLASAKWTIDRLFQEYAQTLKNAHTLKCEQGRYDNHIKALFGHLEPHELDALSIERLKKAKAAKGLADQTINHILQTLVRPVNFGVDMGLCAPLRFRIKKLKLNNQKTEMMTTDELHRFIAACKADKHPHCGNAMLLALYTGMRRGELLKLTASDLDFINGFITLRDPKGGKDQKIPMNQSAREVLQTIKAHPRTGLLFHQKNGDKLTTLAFPAKRIIKAADMPKGFRPFHGLRHSFASMLASSGQVDMYTLQKLMTHKSPIMTQRYAHLNDEALKSGASVLDNIASTPATPSSTLKVVNG